MKITLKVPKDFNFWRTVYSHGWCSLPPFEIDKEKQQLKRIIELPNRNIFLLSIGKLNKSELSLHVVSQNTPTKADLNDLRNQIKICFRVDEDLSEFYYEANKHKIFRWISKMGVGRLLRAPTVFEDVVKMICTTNCSWALTEIMVGNLCKKLGLKIDDGGWTFPSPDSIANTSEKYLRKEIRAGYRAPYLLELSRKVIKGELDIESWRTIDVPTDELFKIVRFVKGIGPYAAGNILKLLGRYDYLAIDSWCRKKFFEIHRDGRVSSDKSIEKFYEPFGKWRGLFFWMDVTKHWYEQKFPF